MRHAKDSLHYRESSDQQALDIALIPTSTAAPPHPVSHHRLLSGHALEKKDGVPIGACPGHGVSSASVYGTRQMSPYKLPAPALTRYSALNRAFRAISVRAMPQDSVALWRCPPTKKMSIGCYDTLRLLARVLRSRWNQPLWTTVGSALSVNLASRLQTDADSSTRIP